ncbi:MAG TPA: cupin domain-containing protein [Gaiellaceae bacterium]|jgi:transcriptional regulator with XRE-family HTH domain
MSEPVPLDRFDEPALDASSIGTRLRVQRERLGLSLREIARRVGVSASLISQIERDKVNPSVSTLWSLVTELGLRMGDIFPEEASPHLPLAARRVQPVGHAVGPDTRAVLNLATGVRWERLTPTRDPLVEFLYVTYEPGSSSCEEDSLVRHGGHEYGYVMSGRLGVRIGFDEYELGPGGSVTFSASAPHRLWAIGGEPVQAIWVVVGREGDPRLHPNQ